MRHRIFVESIAPSLEIGGEEFHHAVHVVRVRQGEEVEVFDGRGHAAHGRVIEVGRHALRIDIDREIESRESPLRVTLAAAIIQLEKFELVLQKATELGVASIIPLITDRIEVRAERYRGKYERWATIALEAVKQSGRSLVPAIEEPTRFDDVVERDSLKFFFDADVEADHSPDRANEVTLLIGPEGGWTEREIALARESRCLFQRLGPRRLRAETAAICAMSIIAARYGDI